MLVKRTPVNSGLVLIVWNVTHKLRQLRSSQTIQEKQRDALYFLDIYEYLCFGVCS